MAITALEHMVLTSLGEHGTLPPGARVLELGESNWYGDVSCEQLEQDIYRVTPDPGECQRKVSRLRQIVAAARPEMLYELARLFLEVALQHSEYSAIDPGTPGSRYKFDLNKPVLLDEQFDLVINIGTAEHIFNIYQFFRTVHERTQAGGLMMHSAPFTGWIDHGFYTFQPTFFFDLARVNHYEILSFICGRISPFRYVQVSEHDDIHRLIQAKMIPECSHINVVFRKSGDSEFTSPAQAYYAGALSAEAHRSWHTLR